MVFGFVNELGENLVIVVDDEEDFDRVESRF